MPRFAATALGSTGGWARHPPHKHTWVKPQAGGQGRLDGSRCLRATRTWEQAWWPSELRNAPTSRGPQGSAGPPISVALVPTRANLGLQPRTSPATRNRGRCNGLCHSPLGGKSSLVPTVEQMAAHPGQAAPTPTSPSPSPTSTSTWPAGPPAPGSLHFPPSFPGLHPTTQHLAQGPCPQGLQGKLTPTLTRSCSRQSPALRGSPHQATSPHQSGSEGPGDMGGGGHWWLERASALGGGARTHAWEGQAGAMTALPHLWEPEGPTGGKHPPHQQPADVGSGRLASVS